MPEETTKSPEKAKKRTNKLTNARIKKEIENLRKLFESVDDPARKELIFSLIDEAAFLKVACFQAKEELKKEGLTIETKNAAQKFTKAHPASTIYDKYAKQYSSIINSLIDYLPVQEKKRVSKLAAMRNE